jgi:hypothetical protein
LSVALTPLIRAPPAPTFSLKGRRMFRALTPFVGLLERFSLKGRRL